MNELTKEQLVDTFVYMFAGLLGPAKQYKMRKYLSKRNDAFFERRMSRLDELSRV